MIGQAAVTASSTPRPASSPEQKAAADTTTPVQSSQSFERRAVDVPEHEQLKPETVALGMAQDFYNERPWLPWVVVAFLLGYILGRARS